MSVREFIKRHRKEIDRYILKYIGEDEYIRRNDSERRLWVLNAEGLYRWAKSEGVRI